MDAVKLPLLFKSVEHTISVDATCATQLRWQRDLFVHSLSQLSHQDISEPGSPAELVLKFVGFLVDTDVSLNILKPVLQSFHHDFLTGSDIHSLISSLPVTSNGHKELLSAYYTAAQKCSLLRAPHSALLDLAEHEQASLLAVFGGQSTNNPKCLTSLASLHSTYNPLLAELLDSTAAPLLRDLCHLPETQDYYCGRYIDLLTWLNDPSKAPSTDFLSQAPVSMPLIGLKSLSHYCVACKVLGKTPGELRSYFGGATGHSQGLIIAAVVSIADSWQSFYDAARLAIELLFWLGYYCHQARPNSSVSPALVKECLEGGEGQPSFMLSVRGFARPAIESLLRSFNESLRQETQLHLALENARDNFVIAGPVSSLVHLNSQIRALKANEGSDQARIPFSSRKPVIQHQFLPINVPFHTEFLRIAAEKIKIRLSHYSMPRDQLMISVCHSMTGDDLRTSQTSDLLPTLVDAITCDESNWPSALHGADATHIITFDAGISDLTMKVKEGEGVRVIDASDLMPREKGNGSAVDLYSSTLLPSSVPVLSWARQFQPRVARSSTGELIVRTKLTQLLGSPPVMVAGMTPTTAHWDFVSTIMKAGYHVELAGGGFYNAGSMTSAIEQLVKTLPPGKGVTCNLIYASPHTMAWQVATLRKLVREGVPIHGLTIGAGIPSPDIVAEYINSLCLKHISFKPGSSAAIREVIEIARAHPSFPIVLQWTGGRGGGHHSYEDFHAPILNLYGAIRKQTNIVLVAGSGFGGANDTFPYLTGMWAARFGYPSMPFDGILLGSRLMVAREAHTSPACKELICQATGVPDGSWEKSYKGPAGGIITVQSEMGQPIHKIANRGVLFWADMDKHIFALPRSERLPALLKNKESIVRRLNADFAKPWFGRTSDGQSADISAMTYSEVLHRMTSLMYVSHQHRWIDPSYTAFVYDFARRTLQRLPYRKDFEVSAERLADPGAFLIDLEAACPEAANAILNPEDSAYFIRRCRAPGQKPVNFIPILDENFEYYFKKDSLWQSEDLDAVVDGDAGRVCILHGPVAAQHSEVWNEPAKDILDNIAKSHVQMLLDEQYQRPETPVSDDESLIQSGSLTPDSWSLASPLSSVTTGIDTPFSCKSPSPQHQANPLSRVSSQAAASFWAERHNNFSMMIQALFNSEVVIRGNSHKPSPLRRILECGPGTALSIDKQGGKIVVEREGDASADILAEISCRDDLSLAVELHHPSGFRDESVTLPFEFTLQPGTNPIMFKEIMDGRNFNIKSFYNKLWFDEELDVNATAESSFCGREMLLTQEMHQNFIATVAQSYSNNSEICGSSEIFPISFGIIIAWEVISKPLVLKDIDGDLLCLVHQSNTFEYCQGASPLRIGDIVSARSQVQEVSIEEAGKYVVVEAEILRSDQPVMIVKSKFLFKGKYNDFETTFRRTKEQDMRLEIATGTEEAVLRDREWFLPDDPTHSLVGSKLLFRLQSTVCWKDRNTFKDLGVTGTVFAQTNRGDLQHIGRVDFQDMDCIGNPVMDFLERKATSPQAQSQLPHPGWSGDGMVEVQIPSSNERYARVSRDYNPIHVSPLFADWAELPGTITHGMYTSAVAASTLEHLAADGSPQRLHRFSATFTDMVLPSDVLTIHLRHVGMVEGRMLIKVSAYKKGTDDLVLDAEAEVEQAKTAYIFTGQGSQAKDMGMQLYNSSPAAKAIWDDVDAYLSETYGWSILDIVRNNPKSLTVHFGGKKGRKIRAKYMSMQIETELPDGRLVMQPILPGLTASTSSYTFSEPRGLLFSTQFAQPAILLLQKATLEDMRAKGLVQDNATYAGHSLGEYGALSAFSGFLSIRDLMDVVFYRGLSMQVSMERDEYGQTGYSMVAANPKRVGKGFDENALNNIVAIIAHQSKNLLEIVNYNVEGEQYVCAGTIQNLHTLSIVLNDLAKNKDASRLVSQAVGAQATASTELCEHVAGFVSRAQRMPKPIELERGIATIPLKGIDVPFHSSHLRAGVNSYRKFLEQRIVASNIKPERLVGKFVPNVMAKVFSLERDYIEEAYKLTQSPRLKELLDRGLECSV